MPEYKVECKFTGSNGENGIKVNFEMPAFTTQEHEELIDFLHNFIRVFKRV